MKLIYVANSGNDTYDGSFARPFRTLQHATDSARDGDIVLVRAGTYQQNWKIVRPGIRVQPYHNELVKHIGRLWITASAPRFTLAGILHNGRNTDGLPSPTVYASDCQFLNVELTNENTAIGYNLGTPAHRADGTSIIGGSIHHVGRVPARNHDHGIYAEACTAIQVVGVQIWQCADRGIQLYYDCQDGFFSTITINACGEGILFSGAGPGDEPGLEQPVASSNNLFDRCAITGSTVRNNIESWYPDGVAPGENNRISRSIIGGGVRGNHGIDASAGGFEIDPSCTLI